MLVVAKKGAFVIKAICVGVILALSSASAVVLAQSFPNKPIRIVVPFPAGGPIDMTTRPLAQKMSDGLGVPVVIDNRGGANGNIGAENVAKSPADGYSMVVGAGGGFAIGPHLYKKLSFDVFKDFTPVSLFVTLPQLLAAKASGSSLVRDKSVVLLFLQTWRATIIPVVAVPVSLIGTCAMMLALGCTFSSLTAYS